MHDPVGCHGRPRATAWDASGVHGIMLLIWVRVQIITLSKTSKYTRTLLLKSTEKLFTKHTESSQTKLAGKTVVRQSLAELGNEM